jgi:hypothetical protein
MAYKINTFDGFDESDRAVISVVTRDRFGNKQTETYHVPVDELYGSNGSFDGSFDDSFRQMVIQLWMNRCESSDILPKTINYRELKEAFSELVY